MKKNTETHKHQSRSHERVLIKQVPGEKRLSALIGSIDEIVFEFDADGTYINVWATNEDLLVRPKQELLGRRASEIFGEEFARPFLEAFRRVLAGGHAESIEYSMEVLGGKRWFLARISPIPAADGSPTTVCVLARDITERKHAEDNLKHTLSLLNATLESTADGILVVNTDGKIVGFNKKFVDMWRIPEFVISSRDDNQALAFVLDQLKDPDGFLKKVKELYDQPEAESFDVLEFKDGRIFERYSHAQRVLGKSVGRVWSFRDVTKRKWAEKVQSAAYRISQATTSSKNLQELFHSIHEIVSELMPARNFYIALYDPPTETFSFPYFVDEHDEVPAPRKRRKGVTEYVLRTGKPLLTSSELLQKLTEQGELELIGTRPVAWLGVPLKTAGESIGVLAVQSYADGISYGEQEKNILIFVSEQVAMAIEHKRAEEALLNSEKRFRALIEHSSEGIVLLDALGTVLYTGNPILGYAVNEWLNRDAFQLIHSEDVGRVKNLFGQLLQKPRSSLTTEFRARHKDGSWRWMEATSNNLLSEPGVKAVVVNYRDITERKHVEETIRQSEERYRSLFEESNDAVFISTPEGKFVDVNPAGVQLFGYSSEEEVLKIDIARDLFWNPADREQYERLIKQQGYVKDYELELKRKDGKKLFVLETARAVRDVQGNVLAYRGILRDITDRKKLEEQLRHVQKMESIGTLAGGIAHDFNNILGIILGHSKLLTENVDADKISRTVDAISKTVDRGAGLVRQLLTFARKADVQFESVNINTVVEDVVKIIKETFPRTITFSLDLKRNLPTINADHNQLHQAVLNLCVNARDAMPDGGTLSITTDLIAGAELLKRQSSAVADEYACISIGDTGTGMDEMTRSRIFEPFFTTKEKGKGTGLGLAVVYGIVQAHSGVIDVGSVVGRGTTFHLCFPVPQWKMKVPETPREAPSEVLGGTETILLVEDEEMLLVLMKTLLESSGYTVLTAANGEEAIELYKQHQHEIAVVVSDMGLPRLGGWEAFRKMKEINPHVQVILASGYVDLQLKSVLLKSGAIDFVQKPYDPNEIMRKIREVMDGKQT